MLSLRRIFRVGLAVGLFALPLFALVDNDGDGLSDIWSALHPTAGAPDLDPDGDGVINRAEAIAGTDPTSALSRFSVAPQRDGAGNLNLHWAGLAGKRYRIEESTDLRNWTELPGEFLGTGGELSSVVRPVGTTGPARLSWRVVVSDADADIDGLNDWEEAQLGTDPARPDTDDDGLLDRIELSLGTNPLVADNPGPILPVLGARLHLRADLGVVQDGSNFVSAWRDISGHGNDAVPSSSDQQPQFVADQLNGRPVVRFDGVDDALNLPDAMAGATEGEIFVVTRLADQTNRVNGLCHFGTADATAYLYGEGVMWDDFGTAATGPQPGPDPALLLQNHILNSSISSDGVSILRFNGREHLRRIGQTVAFRTDPLLGSDWFGEVYQGNIAEVIVYDRVLATEEREAVGGYLAQKYLPEGITVPAKPVLAATAVSGTAADLAWSAPANASLHTIATIERRAGGDDYSVVASAVDVTSFMDTGLAAGQTYTYRLTLGTWAGTAPTSDSVTTTTFASPDLPIAGLRLWLRASTELPGGVSRWSDQSGRSNHATQGDWNRRPQVVAGQLNGFPVVHFTASENQCVGLPDLMAGAEAGEAFVVLRKTDTPNIVGLWAFGTGPGSRYPEYTDEINDDFATDGWYSTGPAPAAALLTAFHVYDVGADDSTWFQAFNGLDHFRQSGGNNVAFRPDPLLGTGNGCFFDGDIAEILIYDRVLSPVERQTVNDFFAAKYLIEVVGTTPLPPPGGR